MCRNLFTYTISLFFIIAFLFPRIASLHALDHLLEDDEPITCELCEFVSVTNEFDLFSGEDFTAQIKSSLVLDHILCVKNYNTPKEKISSPLSIYNKPPPFI